MTDGPFYKHDDNPQRHMAMIPNTRTLEEIDNLLIKETNMSNEKPWDAYEARRMLLDAGFLHSQIDNIAAAIYNRMVVSAHYRWQYKALAKAAFPEITDQTIRENWKYIEETLKRTKPDTAVVSKSNWSPGSSKMEILHRITPQYYEHSQRYISKISVGDYVEILEGEHKGEAAQIIDCEDTFRSNPRLLCRLTGQFKEVGLRACQVKRLPELKDFKVGDTVKIRFGGENLLGKKGVIKKFSKYALEDMVLVEVEGESQQIGVQAWTLTHDLPQMNQKTTDIFSAFNSTELPISFSKELTKRTTFIPFESQKTEVAPGADSVGDSKFKVGDRVLAKGNKGAVVEPVFYGKELHYYVRLDMDEPYNVKRSFTPQQLQKIEVTSVTDSVKKEVPQFKEGDRVKIQNSELRGTIKAVLPTLQYSIQLDKYPPSHFMTFMQHELQKDDRASNVTFDLAGVTTLDYLKETKDKLTDEVKNECVCAIDVLMTSGCKCGHWKK